MAGTTITASPKLDKDGEIKVTGGGRVQYEAKIDSGTLNGVTVFAYVPRSEASAKLKFTITRQGGDLDLAGDSSAEIEAAEAVAQLSPEAMAALVTAIKAQL